MDLRQVQPQKYRYKFLRITDIQDNKVNWDQVPFCEMKTMKLIKFILMTEI
jgi:hypothetical protein